jgi:hypothetical protein
MPSDNRIGGKRKGIGEKSGHAVRVGSDPSRVNVGDVVPHEVEEEDELMERDDKLADRGGL